MGGSIALAALVMCAASWIRDLQALKAERYVGDVVAQRADKAARKAQKRPGNGAAEASGRKGGCDAAW